MSAGAHTLELRNRFIEGIDRSIIDLGHHQEDPTFTLGTFWIDSIGNKFFRLCLGRCQLPLRPEDGLLQASTFDDLIEQLDQIRIIAGFGGLDDALVACVDPSENG